MKHALIDFYYQFHTKQHYFLCHDILEEAWKAQNHYSKTDAVVSLILCATGCYHYRRANYKGAHTLFQRAYRVAHLNRYVLSDLGLKGNDYMRLLKDYAQAAQRQLPFEPMELPVLHAFTEAIQSVYPDYTMMQQVSTLPYICDHHLLRDRHEVENARLEALKLKQLKDKK